jgi:hypothetical protein
LAGLKKFLLITIVILFGCFINPIQTLASGEEQSVLGQIGKDGDSLINYLLVQKIKTGEAIDQNNFGNAISVTCLDNQIIVGLTGDNAKGKYSGAVYIYGQNTDGNWNQKFKLTASDGNAYDFFGRSIAVSGNIMAVSAILDDDKGQNSGSVYIFERGYNGNWSQKTKLIANDGTENDYFGWSVAVSGNIVVVGTPDDDDKGETSGSVYIFERDENGNWNQKTKLTASDGALGDNFGFSVAILGNILTVGAPYDDAKGQRSGSTYIFERNSNGNWNQKKKLTASDGTEDCGFGAALAISGDTLVIGAPMDNAKGFDSGSVYIFGRNSSGKWKQKTKFTASDVAEVDNFGNSVAISGNVVVVSSPFDDDKGAYSGSVYIFERDSKGNWNQRSKLTVVDGVKEDFFGCAAAIFGKTVVVCSEKKAVYTYQSNGIKELLISDTQKYLVFKVARSSVISTKETLKNKIRFEAVGLNRVTNKEDADHLTLSNVSYFQGFAYNYYIVDISELETRYFEECSNKFQLGDGGLGHFIYEQLQLRVRYDSPVNEAYLKDVYITDKIDIDTQEMLTLDIESSLGGATINWTEYESDLIQGYQVVVSTNSAEPTEAVDLTKLYTMPVAAYENLSAKNQYYLWIRGVDTSGNAGPWTSKVFSPQPAPASFVNEKSTSIASSVEDQPQYSIKLKVTDVDAANYVIYRENSDGSEKIELDPVDYTSLSTADFFCDGGSKLVKHETYTYSVYTTNALGEAATKSNNIVMKVANLVPQECTVTTGWRATEVYTKLSLQLGPVTDLEGDSLAYRVYVRTPGADNEACVATLEPTTVNETMTVDYTFNNKANYEWQVRCIEKNISDATEVGNVAWNKMYIDTDAILIIAKNDFGVNTWGTKKQPLSFAIEKNAAKTYFDYQWYFNDDGATARGETVTHTYSNLAIETPYQVAVTAVDASGVSHQGSADIYIVNTPKGKLYDNEAWSGTCGITGLVIVPEGITLTIAAGTTVQLNGEAGGFQVSGTLKAIDAAGSITMDLQTDSDLWQGVKFQDAGWGMLTGVTISHASQGVSAEGSGTIALEKVTLSENVYGLYYSSGTVTANQCKFKCNTNGIKFEGIADFAALTLTNCTFTGNTQVGLDNVGKLTVDDLNEIGSNSGNEAVEE